MTDFVLPTNAQIANVDVSGYTLYSDDAGLIIEEQAAVFKNLIDQMSASETVHIRSNFQSTGKTEKFIIADCTVLPTIVTTDQWLDAVLPTSNFFTLSGNNDKVFKHRLPTATATLDDDDNVTNVNTTILGDSAAADIDMTGNVTAMNSAQMASLDFQQHMNMAEIKNHADTALGTASDDFQSDLTIFIPNMVNIGIPAAWTQDYILNIMCASFNELSVNGAMVVCNMIYSKVNQSYWTMLAAQDSAGRTYETEFIQVDGSGADIAIIKRLS